MTDSVCTNAEMLDRMGEIMQELSVLGKVTLLAYGEGMKAEKNLHDQQKAATQ